MDCRTSPLRVLESEPRLQHSPFTPLVHVGDGQASAFRNASTTALYRGEGEAEATEQPTAESINEGLEQHSKESQRSDDSFSAYIEHPIRESTPPRVGHQLEKRPGPHDVSRRVKSRTTSEESGSSLDAGDIDAEEQGLAWPATIDREGEQEQEEGRDASLSQGSILIPDLQDQDDDDGDIDGAGEKKRRRRTNKAEASVLASVFAQTQFPDAHTREALAQRLNMNAKAVSIWFQNRRQAMKKRASRFGGVEGVNGPTVTAANMQIMDVKPAANERERQNSRDCERETLKRWMSLDEIASLERGRGDGQSIKEVEMPDLGSLIQQEDPAETKLSSTPILDFLCQRKGETRLSRMASMPSLASLLAAKEERSKADRHKKDLRDLLPLRRSNSRPELQRSSSAFTVVKEADAIEVEAKPPGRERCYSLQMNKDGRATLGAMSLAPGKAGEEHRSSSMQGKGSFPALFLESLQRQKLLGSGASRNIWQRMESSSSSSDGCRESPDSNKENRDPNDTSRQHRAEDEEEDEERTLRKIAGRRAARDLAKKEERLSKEGKRYLLEADARLALQHRKRSQDHLGQRLERPGAQYGHSRSWNRAVSEAQAMSKSRTILTRVPSLDMTAGRDRSKDDERSTLDTHFEMRMAAKQSHQSSTVQDENAAPIPSPSFVTSAGHKRSRYNALRQSHTGHPSQPSQASVPRRPTDHTLLRRFAPSHSLPSSTTSSLLSTRLSAAFPPFYPLSNRFESARESSARLDGAKRRPSVPSSQNSSENGSDDWVEAWAQEKRGAGAGAGAGGLMGGETGDRRNVLKERSILLNADPRAMAKQPSARHDDSGFYGSDSGDEEGEEGNGARKGSMKHRLISQESSSPSKRGDERDRLAAETLLGLGSRS